MAPSLQNHARMEEIMRSFALAAGSFGVTAIFIGLAIWGEGGIAAYVSHPALIALAVVTMGLAGAAAFSQGNLDSGTIEDRSNRWVLVGFTIIAILAGWLPAFMDRLDIWTFGGDRIRWLGVAVYSAGGMLRLIPVFVLGRRFSGLVAIQRDHQLVTTGMYRYIRHPSYLGMLITMVGWALSFRSTAGLILATLALIPIIGRIRAEEGLLRSQFGAHYDAYLRRTWRMVPWIY
jgi:protein-S-isoprenylcysteine O-methyltransferase Ste14